MRGQGVQRAANRGTATDAAVFNSGVAVRWRLWGRAAAIRQQRATCAVRRPAARPAASRPRPANHWPSTSSPARFAPRYARCLDPMRTRRRVRTPGARFALEHSCGHGPV